MFEQIVVWTGAGIGALGAAVLAAGTVAVLLLGRDGADGSAATAADHRAEVEADLPMAA